MSDVTETVLCRIESTVRRIGLVAALVLLPCLILVRNLEVLLRNTSVAPASVFNAMEGELFMMFVFLIVGAAVVADKHVRVDILRDRFTAQKKALTEVLGALFLILPFTVIMLWYSSWLVESAWSHGERAAIGLGAPIRWVIIATLPAGVFLFAVAALVRAIRCIRFLSGRGPDPFGDQT